MELVDYFWILVTTLGDEKFYVAIVPIVYLSFSMELGVELALVFLSSMWLNGILKYTLRMPRPPKELWKVEAKGYSFPSGHTQATTTFWTFLALEKKSKVIASIALVLVPLVAYSRVYLGVHYVQDVVGGALIGAILVTSYSFLKKKLPVIPLHKRATIGLSSSALMWLLSIAAGNYYDPTSPSLAGILLGYFLAKKEKLKLPESKFKRGLTGLLGLIFSTGLYIVSHKVSDFISFALCYVLLGFSIAYLVPKISSKLFK